ncbi:hypothetical protein AVEN_92915-1 [Araneus ventricosus]|uniref:Uncharacterized protein n=1 Tax=Araneus ventricosus TaxID=182803 RepID=A0A4Y2D1V9_ARAVE|nr:hypothetical protein AVEN_92915-1 [Araneus ventricosus]
MVDSLPAWVIIYPTTQPFILTFPYDARKWSCGKDNWTLRALRSDLRTSTLTQKEVNPLSTGSFREIFDRPGSSPVGADRLKLSLSLLIYKNFPEILGKLTVGSSLLESPIQNS